MTSHDVIAENFQEKIDKKDTTQRDLPGKGFKGWSASQVKVQKNASRGG